MIGGPVTAEKFSTEVFVEATPVAAAPRPSRVFLVCKRASDLFFALLLLPVLGLIALLLLALNPFLNPGPLFFVQRRVGKDERHFRILKFRTMVGATAAEARFESDERARLTRLGRFLRATRIDELPQIVNVLRGEMSMVGPRPEQVSFYQRYKRTIPGYAERQRVRPGITGLAQLKYGYTEDDVGTMRKLRWDLQYIRNMGFRRELWIIGKTIAFVFGRLLRIPVRRIRL